jgi:glutamate synthase (NADPH/NADH) small chain
MPNDYRRVLNEQAALARRCWPSRSLSANEAGRLMGELRGFMRIGTGADPGAGPAERAHDYREFTAHAPVAELREQGGRCMDCGVPFCHNGCPLGNLIPDWNDLVYRDRWQDAIRAAAPHQQLPRVHRPAVPGALRGGLRARDPRGRRGHDQADRERDHRPRVQGGLGDAAAAERRERAQRRVVGSGPAGWPRRSSCAAPATRRRVRARRGGRRARALRRARLQDREVGRAAARRAAARRGCRACASASTWASTSMAQELRSEFDAVVLAIGSRVPRDLPVPGRELDGVHFAMEYLYERNRWVAGEHGPPRVPRRRRQRDQRRRQARGRDRRRRHRRGLRRQCGARGRRAR